MYTVQRIEDWADRHHPKWLDLIRVLLGFIILIKGIAFISNREEVINMIQISTSQFTAFIIAHYVIASFLVGGLAIVLGFLTRIACLMQVPALLGSVIFVDYHKNLFALNSQAAYSILILFLLLFYFFYGAGVYSVDSYMKTHKEEE